MTVRPPRNAAGKGLRPPSSVINYNEKNLLKIDLDCANVRKRRPRRQNKCRRNSLYDSKGKLIDSGIDLCDCLEIDCPGCHFPCSRCKSSKCGHVCRVYRPWKFEYIGGTDEDTSSKSSGNKKKTSP